MKSFNELFGGIPRTLKSVLAYTTDIQTARRTISFPLQQDVQAGYVIDSSGKLVDSTSTDAFVVFEPIVEASDGAARNVVVHWQGGSPIILKAEGLVASDLEKAISLLSAQSGVAIADTFTS